MQPARTHTHTHKQQQWPAKICDHLARWRAALRWLVASDGRAGDGVRVDWPEGQKIWHLWQVPVQINIHISSHAPALSLSYTATHTRSHGSIPREISSALKSAAPPIAIFQGSDNRTTTPCRIWISLSPPGCVHILARAFSRTGRIRMKATSATWTERGEWQNRGNKETGAEKKGAADKKKKWEGGGGDNGGRWNVKKRETESRGQKITWLSKTRLLWNSRRLCGILTGFSDWLRNVSWQLKTTENKLSAFCCQELL